MPGFFYVQKNCSTRKKKNCKSDKILKASVHFTKYLLEDTVFRKESLLGCHFLLQRCTIFLKPPRKVVVTFEGRAETPTPLLPTGPFVLQCENHSPNKWLNLVLCRPAKQPCSAKWWSFLFSLPYELYRPFSLWSSASQLIDRDCALHMMWITWLIVQ